MPPCCSYMTEEGQEGRNAFNEKRRPRLLQIQAESLMTLALYRYQLPLTQTPDLSRPGAGGARGSAGAHP